MRPVDRPRYCDKVPGSGAFAVLYARKRDYDNGSCVRAAGYGAGVGGWTHGPQTDQKTAGDGKWETVRNAEPGRPGLEGGEQHRRGRCLNGDQRPSVQSVLRGVHNGDADVRWNNTQKLMPFFVKKCLTNGG